mmetsp:Transcript_183/g.274  ORF Transcript_183/g.274 Transcript_183/m.274 type:complete len:265 (+) Transcript_183:112-906(+)|eukprot:CAMPEP_0176488236 /NCGR_PEP_ID=MMETSP0200_2-20121128/6596_1 /TAXON_ID=947934 /ORGANISM="Chaetoceros sp., Strain GSL56" /LENGTH=264 /DNA_ID=CAMNT_0017885195 /DNA_START=155 /DNA_END=949 /DNA_ORIENTATION=+
MSTNLPTANPLYTPPPMEGSGSATNDVAAAVATATTSTTAGLVVGESVLPPNPMHHPESSAAPIYSNAPLPPPPPPQTVPSMNDSYDGLPDATGASGNKDEYEEIREQDRYLPIANIARIMKNTLPENAKIAKDSKETVQECVSEFISFITSEASDKCMQEKRKTINGDDLLWAMSTLGFDKYVEPLKIYLSKYREAIRGDKPEGKVGGGGGTGGVGGVGGGVGGGGGSGLGRPPATAANVGEGIGLPTGYAPVKGGGVLPPSL